MVPDEEYPSAVIMSVGAVLRGSTGRADAEAARRRRAGRYAPCAPRTAYRATRRRGVGRHHRPVRTAPLVQEPRRNRRRSRLRSGSPRRHWDRCLKRWSQATTRLQVCAAGEAKARALGCTGWGYRTIVASGPRTGSVVPTPTSRELREGELVMFSISPTDERLRVVGRRYDRRRRQAHRRPEAPAQRHGPCLRYRPQAVRRSDEPVSRWTRRSAVPPRQAATRRTCSSPTFTRWAYSRRRVRSLVPRSHVTLTPHMTVCVDVSLFGMPELHGARFESGV